MKAETKCWLLYTVLPFMLIFVGGFLSMIVAEIAVAYIYGYQLHVTEAIMNILTPFNY
jgi:hypothetical protein